MVSDGHVASIRDLRNATSGTGAQGLGIDLSTSFHASISCEECFVVLLGLNGREDAKSGLCGMLSTED